MAQFRITSTVLQGAVYPLEGEYFTLGREPDNTLHINHASISKHHAMLTVEQTDFKLWDLHSTKGLIVNGEKTVIRHLQDGDRIVLGEIELRFEINGAAPHKPPAPVPDDRRVTQQMAVLPPPAQTRAEIRTGLEKTLTKMGVDLPSPPQPRAKPPTYISTQPAEPPPPALVPAPLAAPPTPTAKMPDGFLSRFFRKRTASPTPAPPPPSREEIRTALATTFTKLGVELPTATPRVTPPAYSPPRDVAQPAETIPPAPPQPISLPEPAAPPPPRRSARWLYLILLIGGVVLLALGYSVNQVALKFLGILGIIIGFSAGVFALRFGGIIVPPRE